jgi:integrase
MSRARGDGLYRRPDSAIWWCSYKDATGRRIRLSTGTGDKEQARRELDDRRGRAVRGEVLLPGADKVTVNNLADDLVIEYTVNRRRSLERLEDALTHVRATFGQRRAQQVTTPEIRAYVRQRQESKVANATINYELAALKRAFRLAQDAGRIMHRCHIPMLEVRNARKGFFDREQFEAFRKALPDYAQPAVTAAFITGWRTRDELLTRQWKHVDFTHGWLRLEPNETKNGEGRMFPLTPELRACLEVQRATTEALQRKTGRIIPWVFHRDGQPLKTFYKAWHRACRAAGVPGRIPHDLRRTAVRNLERAGVPRSAAMAMVGHKTESIYRRYAIVDEAMLKKGAEQLAKLEATR